LIFLSLKKEFTKRKNINIKTGKISKWKVLISKNLISKTQKQCKIITREVLSAELILDQLLPQDRSADYF